MYSSPTRSVWSTRSPRSSTRWKVTPGCGPAEGHRAVGHQVLGQLEVGDGDGGLGRAVPVEHPELGRGRPQGLDVGQGAGFAAQGDDLDGAVSQLVHLRAGQQELQVAGREAGIGDALPLDGPEEGPREEQRLAGTDDHGAPHEQGGEQGAERTVEVERGDAQCSGTPIEAEHLGRRADRGQEGTVADEHSLGRPRGPRRVDGVDHPVGRPLPNRGRRPARVPELGVPHPRRTADREGRTKILVVLVTGHHDDRGAVGHDGVHSGLGVGDRQWDEQCPDPHGG